jgi:hypothetical protein
MIATRTEPARTVLPPGKPRVVVVRARKTLVQGYDADRGALRAMLEAGLLALSGEKDVARALGRYVRPGERIGLKINGLAARQAATHVELVDELAALAAKAGVDPGRQIAFDRFKRDLIQSGFAVGPSYQPGSGEVANALLFATDLVAVDTVGLGILEDLRKQRGLTSLAQEGLHPTYLATAAKLGLGVHERANIEVISLEV